MTVSVYEDGDGRSRPAQVLCLWFNADDELQREWFTLDLIELDVD